MKYKIGFAIAGLTATKEAIAVAAGASLAAVALSPALGFDPWPWVLGAVGGAIAQAWLPSDQITEKKNRVTSVLAWLHGRKLHLFNIMASIILAGLGADYLVAVIKFQGWPVPSVHFVAFVFAAVWPFAAHLAWKKALKWSES